MMKFFLTGGEKRNFSKSSPACYPGKEPSFQIG
jgi:hypothetical protein